MFKKLVMINIFVVEGGVKVFVGLLVAFFFLLIKIIYESALVKIGEKM